MNYSRGGLSMFVAKRNKRRESLKTVQFPLLFIILLISFSFLVFKYITVEQSQIDHREIRSDVSTIVQNLDQNFVEAFDKTIFIANRLSKLSPEQISALSSKSFRFEGSELILLLDNNYIVRKLFVSNAGKRFWDQRDKLIGRNLAELEISKQLFDLVRTSQKVTVSSEINLGKDFKTAKFVAAVPEGYLIVAYPCQELLSKDIPIDFLNDYHIYIADQNNRIIFNNRNDINSQYIDASLEQKIVYNPPVNSFNLQWQFNIKPSFNFVKILLPYMILVLSLSSAFLFVFVLFYRAREQKQSEIIFELENKLDEESLNNNKTVKGLRLLAKNFREEFEAAKQNLIYQRSSAYRVMCEAIKSKQEQGKVEELLKQNINRLMMALESTNTGTWTWDIVENRIVWDDQTHELFDLSPETFLGTYENLLNLIHSEDRNKFDLVVKAALTSQGEIRTEFRVPRNYGRERVLRLSGRIYRDGLEQPVHVTGTITDVTEDKQAQEIMSRFFTLSVDLFCVASKEGRFTRLSPTWTDALGYSLEELMAHPFMYFVHPLDRKRTQAEFQILTSQSHRTINFENRYRAKDGRYRNLLWNAVSLPDEKTIYAVARDITDLRIENLRRVGRFVGVSE